MGALPSKYRKKHRYRQDGRDEVYYQGNGRRPPRTKPRDSWHKEKELERLRHELEAERAIQSDREKLQRSLTWSGRGHGYGHRHGQGHAPRYGHVPEPRHAPGHGYEHEDGIRLPHDEIDEYGFRPMSPPVLHERSRSHDDGMELHHPRPYPQLTRSDGRPLEPPPAFPSLGAVITSNTTPELAAQFPWPSSSLEPYRGRMLTYHDDRAHRYEDSYSPRTPADSLRLQLGPPAMGHSYSAPPTSLDGRNINATHFPEAVTFFGPDEPHFGFATLSKHTVYYRKKLYPTAEHLLQAFKFLKHRPDVAEHIRTNSADPMDAIKEAEYYIADEREDWRGVRIKKMDEVLYLKFTQHPPLRDELVRTHPWEIVYASSGDDFWGAGEDGNGRNELGLALMRTRARLKREGLL